MPGSNNNKSPRARFVKVPARKVAQVPAYDAVVDDKVAQRILPENKRKVLEDLLSKEQERAKRSKLATILVQKLTVKYGRCVRACVRACLRASGLYPNRRASLLHLLRLLLWLLLTHCTPPHPHPTPPPPTPPHAQFQQGGD